MRRGEIWLINLDPTIGAEIRKTRPAVIVNRDSIGILPLKVIVPVTEWQEQFETAPWLIPITPTPLNGLSKKSAADTFQVRSVSEKRFVRKIGDVSEDKMEEISKGLLLSLDLD